MTDLPIIEIKGLGKKYIISHQRGGYTALRDVLMGIVKKPLTFASQKFNKLVGREKMEEFWALKNINLTIRRGEVVGIIGANGAGKSTLLKILTGITPPTEGEAILRGHVSSLLEVGTGFHPELTGRENIYLNGAILGMKKREIQKRFNEIVAFAGIDKFLDTPVKHYSSGMYVRLAFSVAAHLEPDILLVDEVLAVGDAEFQKKCLGKMEEVTTKQGRTILFVSHNLSAIQSLCPQTILLSDGQVKAFGSTAEVIEEYRQKNIAADIIDLAKRQNRSGDGRLKITGFKLVNQDGQSLKNFVAGDEAQIWLDYEVKDPKLTSINLALGIDSLNSGQRLTQISNQVIKKVIPVKPTGGVIKIIFPRLPLNAGLYQVTIFADDQGKIVDWVKGAGQFNVLPGDFYPSGQLPAQGSLLLDYDFTHD